MGYRMNGSPAKLGTIQGTSGHKAALEEASPNKFNAAILTTLAKTVGKVVKKGAKFVKGVVTKKGGGKTGIPKGSGKGSASFAAKGSGKTGTGVDTKPSTSTVPKDAEGNIKMSQQVRQEKRLAKVSERRRSKGKGKSTREVMLEKKVAMTPDERIRWNQAQTKQYIDLGVRAGSMALGGGHGGGYSSGGADFSRTLPSEGETAQRKMGGTGFQIEKSGIEKANVGPPYENEAPETKPETEQPKQKDSKGYDKYLYGE